ncbi:hypothetical protein L208DRAFT_1463077 [Tricholoma matsutake]|nr:hypothetical protein L208DRAFT_1463077 [Tricholoma matsutake 945]
MCWTLSVPKNQFMSPTLILAADAARWAKLVTDYGKKLSEFASYVDQSVSIAEILPGRKSDKPLLNLIVVRKRKRVSDSGVENEEEDQLVALNVYSKRQPPSPQPCMTTLTRSLVTFPYGTLRNPQAQKLHLPPLHQCLSESHKRGSPIFDGRLSISMIIRIAVVVVRQERRVDGI